MSSKIRWRRVFRYAARALLGLGLGLLLLMLLGLGTRTGRNLLLAEVLPLVNDAIPGSVQVGDFEELSFDGLQLRGVSVHDPQGKPVLTLERLRVECQLTGLRADALRVRRVELDRGFVDVREIEQERSGPVAAFVDPDAPAPPPSEEPPPYVRVEHIELREFRVMLPQPSPEAPTQIRDLNLDGSFELDGTPRAEVQSLTFSLLRESEPLVRLSKLSGLFGRGTEASSLAFEADLAGVSVQATAQGVLPPNEGHETAPLAAELHIQDITAKRIALLARDASMEGAFEGTVDAELTVSGSLHALETRLRLHTGAGPVLLDARLKSLRELAFEIETTGFDPSALIVDAPSLTLIGRLSAETDIEHAPETLPVHALRLRSASADGEALPNVDAALLLTDRSLRNLKLDVEDDHSEVRVLGEAGFDGSAELQVEARLEAETLRRLALLAGHKRRVSGRLSTDLAVRRTPDGSLAVDGDLSGQKLAFADKSVGRVNLKVSLEGQPPELSGSVKLDARNLRAGDFDVRTAAVELRGGPKKYAVKVSGRTNQGDVDLSIDAEREGEAVRLEGKIRGQRGGRAVEVVVLDTRVNPRAGSVETKGLDVRFGEQKLELRGKATRKHAALEIHAASIDLAAFNPLLPKDTQVAGTVTLDARVGGNVDRPDVALELEARRVSVGDHPSLDLALKGNLSTSQGKGDVELSLSDAAEARTGKRLLLSLSAESQFETGPSWVNAIQDGEHRVRLDLEKLDLAFVPSLMPDIDLPVDGEARGSVELQGRVDSPRLALELDTDLAPAWTKRRLRVFHELSIEDERLELELDIDDPEGNWIDISATTSLPAFAEIVKNPEQLAETERWQVRADFAERDLAALPLPLDLREALPSATLLGSLYATHEPNQEPDVVSRLALRQKKSIEVQPGCITEQLGLESRLSLKGGRVELHVSGRQAERQLVELEARAELGLVGALAGGKPELGRIHAKLHSRDLELRRLPYVCERFGGRVNLTARVDDPLGSRPDARVALKIEGLTAGSTVSVDTAIDAFVVAGEAGLDAEVRHGADVSTVTARIPVTFSGGRLRVDDAAQARGAVYLKQLPIEPFLDPEGAISYATGTLSGQARLSGTLKQPHLAGAIELEQLGFTATDVAQPLRNIVGRIEFTESTVKLKGLRAQDKEGTLRLDGTLELADTERIEGDFRLHAEDFPLRQQGQVVATTDVDARIRSTLTPELTRVRVELHDVDTWLENAELRTGIALAGHPDVIVDGVPAFEPQEPVPQEKSPPQRNESPASREQPRKLAEASSSPEGPSQELKVTEIVLDARDRFWVKRNDFAVKLAALLTARIQGKDVNVEGRVEIDRGYLSLFGKLFEIQRGSDLEFIGSPQPNPVLNIEAVHENRRSGEDVRVRITGRGSEPKLAFFVDGVGVTAGDAFVALFGAQRSNEDPDAAGDQARDFVGGLTAGILATTARRELGAAAPVIMVEPGGGEETRVRAGFELDSLVPGFLRPIVTGLYFEGIVANDQDASTQDANVHGGALLEVYFPHDFFTTGQYGPGSTWSVDVGWQL